jgi:hypothetical protein
MTARQVREVADWLAALIHQATSEGGGCPSRSPVLVAVNTWAAELEP